MDAIQGVLEASPDAVLVVDDEGVIRRANRNVEAVLGYAPDELEGTVVEDLLPGPDREDHVGFREEYMADPEPRPMGRELDLYALHADGTEIPVEISLGPIELDGDLYVVATVSDVSNRKRRERELRASEERYRRLLETSPAPIVIYGPGGEIRYANDAAADLVDADSPEAVVGRAVLDFVHPDEREAVRERMRRTVDEGVPTDRVERRLVTPDGGVRHAIISTSPIRYREDPAVQVVLNDITGIKRHERELERQNERLEEFASVISHDLRNPLNVLEGSLDLAEETGDPEQFERCRRAIGRMERLIDDVLALARHGQPVSELGAVDLAGTARGCFEAVEGDGARLRTETEGEILADGDRLRRLLANLFRNAVEHAGPGVTVTVGSLDSGFYVEDDGPGIPEADREAVFERGYTTASEGTGFGLAIVREIADAHGWECTLADGEGGGARFEFSGVETP